METRFKLRLSRMFQASFGSCRSRNLSDIIEKAVFVPRIDDQSFRSIDSVSMAAVKLRPFPSICRPNSSETTESIASSRDLLIPRSKVSERSAVEILEPFLSETSGDRTFLPVSPLKVTEKKRTAKKKKKKKTGKNRKMELNFGGTWWYSSEDEDEDETDTLFSSKSRSSDSSGSHRRKISRRDNHRRRERAAAREKSSEMGLIPLKGKVKNSFAVVKRSSDPYNDFRNSMLEMIIEKQIFSAKDLEQLLQCFLSLNSCHHHRVILEVFTEIWEALFSDWGS